MYLSVTVLSECLKISYADFKLGSSLDRSLNMSSSWEFIIFDTLNILYVRASFSLEIGTNFKSVERAKSSASFTWFMPTI